MKPLAEAQRDVLDAVGRLPVRRVALEEARGLVLAAPVVAPHPVPPFANSAMDGFAVRSTDAREVPATLTVVEDVPAGQVAAHEVVPGTAIKIMTGAPMPAGADAVVPVEDTREDQGRVTILSGVEAGVNVRAAGGDVPAGAEVFAAGERLGPAHLGVLASLGMASPTVWRRPRVAILSTGDEIRPAETDELAPGQIRDSNRPVLGALLAELGAEILDFGIIPDDADRLRSTLRQAAETADLILTSGGVSMGEYDLVKIVLGELGRVDFWQVAMQPGKPFAFGKVAGTPLLGLPGNPVSVLVAFEQLARPALLTMMGSEKIFRPRLIGRLRQAVSTNPEKVVFLRVRATWEPGGWVADLSGGQLSNMLSAVARANAFAVIPVGTGELGEGEEVELEMFGWPETRSRQEVLDG